MDPVYQTAIPVDNEIPTAQGQSLKLAYFVKAIETVGDYDKVEQVPWLFIYEVLELNDLPTLNTYAMIWT